MRNILERCRIAPLRFRNALTTHNDPARHWAGDHGLLNETAVRDRIAEAIRTYEDADDDPINARAWRFTPESFRKIMTMLQHLKLIELDPVRVYNTPRDRPEFCAVLMDARPKNEA